jgi:hypothetical protein
MKDLFGAAEAPFQNIFPNKVSRNLLSHALPQKRRCHPERGRKPESKAAWVACVTMLRQRILVRIPFDFLILPTPSGSFDSA